MYPPPLKSDRETVKSRFAHALFHCDLVVGLAGYSDHFCDLSKELQEDIIARTEHRGF